MSPALIAYSLLIAPQFQAPANLESAYNSASQAYENDSSDENRMKLAKAAFQYGEEIMLDNDLPPMKKYPDALRLFRESTKLNPADPSAQENIDLIEGIYESMGRPVPQ